MLVCMCVHAYVHKCVYDICGHIPIEIRRQCCGIGVFLKSNSGCHIYAANAFTHWARLKLWLPRMLCTENTWVMVHRSETRIQPPTVAYFPRTKTLLLPSIVLRDSWHCILPGLYMLSQMKHLKIFAWEWSERHFQKYSKHASLLLNENQSWGCDVYRTCQWERLLFLKYIC